MGEQEYFLRLFVQKFHSSLSSCSSDVLQLCQREGKCNSNSILVFKKAGNTK